MTEPASDVLIAVDHVSMDYWAARRGRRPDGAAPALDDVSLELRAGETLAVVGESGSGKSTLARIVMGLQAPTSGTVAYRGAALATMGRAERAGYRRQVQLVFQDPETSLSPRLKVSAIVAEGWIANPGIVARRDRPERIRELLALVGLSPRHADRYPHELSGGQRQRLGIARALAVDPSVLVCDEPVSSLDVSVQAQIINLFQRLKRELDVSYVFIAHDLAVVRHLSDRAAVLAHGRLVESGPTEQVFDHPREAYTRRLLASVPRQPPPLSAARLRRIQEAARVR